MRLNPLSVVAQHQRHTARSGSAMSGIVGAVFIITMLNCLFGLADQAFQALKRRWKA
jgi:hypothetical protein